MSNTTTYHLYRCVKVSLTVHHILGRSWIRNLGELYFSVDVVSNVQHARYIWDYEVNIYSLILVPSLVWCSSVHTFSRTSYIGCQLLNYQFVGQSEIGQAGRL